MTLKTPTRNSKMTQTQTRPRETEVGEKDEEEEEDEQEVEQEVSMKKKQQPQQVRLLKLLKPEARQSALKCPLMSFRKTWAQHLTKQRNTWPMIWKKLQLQHMTMTMRKAKQRKKSNLLQQNQRRQEHHPGSEELPLPRKKRSIPSQTLTMNRKQLWKQNMRHRALVPEASQQRHRPTASPHQKETRVANRKTLLPKRPPRQLHEKLARRSTRTHPAYMINFFCAHEDVMCVLCGVMGFDCLLNHVIFVIVNSVCENIMLVLLDHFRKLPSGDKHFHPAWFGREPASSAFARRLCQPKAPSSDSHGRGFRRDQVVNPDDSNRNSSQN